MRVVCHVGYMSSLERKARKCERDVGGDAIKATRRREPGPSQTRPRTTSPPSNLDTFHPSLVRAVLSAGPRTPTRFAECVPFPVMILRGCAVVEESSYQQCPTWKTPNYVQLVGMLSSSRLRTICTASFTLVPCKSTVVPFEDVCLLACTMSQAASRFSFFACSWKSRA